MGGAKRSRSPQGASLNADATTAGSVTPAVRAGTPGVPAELAKRPRPDGAADVSAPAPAVDAADGSDDGPPADDGVVAVGPAVADGAAGRAVEGAGGATPGGDAAAGVAADGAVTVEASGAVRGSRADSTEAAAPDGGTVAAPTSVRDGARDGVVATSGSTEAGTAVAAAGGTGVAVAPPTAGPDVGSAPGPGADEAGAAAGAVAAAPSAPAGAAATAGAPSPPSPSTDATPEERVRSTIKALLNRWAADLAALPESERRTYKVRAEFATCEQTVDHLRPLLRHLRKRTLSRNILRALEEIFAHVAEREYVRANDRYLQLAIGNAPWPMGATMVGIHARSAREKIGEGKVAHVMNDEETRKYITAIKRLVTLAQKYNPTVPSSGW